MSFQYVSGWNPVSSKPLDTGHPSTEGGLGDGVIHRTGHRGAIHFAIAPYQISRSLRFSRQKHPCSSVFIRGPNIYSNDLSPAMDLGKKAKKIK
jgi:hypothetical protein